MNFCSRLMASGSLHLWKKIAATPSSGVQNYHIWKVACTTVAAPFSAAVEADPCDGASASAEKSKVASSQMGKRKIFKSLKSLTVETVDLIIREEEKKGVFVNQADLVSWAKRLKKKDDKPENALEIFRWMDRKKFKFSADETALYVDLIAKVKGLAAAELYFGKVDPNFNNQDPNARNWPAYLKILYWKEVNEKNSLVKRFILTRHDRMDLFPKGN